MIDRNRIVKDWHVVFENQGRVNVWGILAPGAKFTHCEAVGRDAFSWVTVRPINAGFKVMSTHIKAQDDVMDYLIDSDLIEMVKAPVFKKKKPRVILFAPWTCVEVCKSVIGLGCWYIVTPDQLYQFLKLNGDPPAKWKVKNIAFGFMAHIMAIIYSLIQLIKKVFKWAV